MRCMVCIEAVISTYNIVFRKEHYTKNDKNKFQKIVWKPQNELKI